MASAASIRTIVWPQQPQNIALRLLFLPKGKRIYMFTTRINGVVHADVIAHIFNVVHAKGVVHNDGVLLLLTLSRGK